MISNLRDNLSQVKFLQYNGERQANGHPAKLPEGKLNPKSDFGKATQITISDQAAKISSHNLGDRPKITFPAEHEFKQIKLEYKPIEGNFQIGGSSEEAQNKSRLVHLNMEIKRNSMPELNGELHMINSELKLHEGFLERRPKMQTQLEKLRNTQPVAAKVLNEDEMKAAYKLADMLGKRVGGAGDFTYSFVHEDTLYTFTREGEVQTNEVNIPTSAADKSRRMKGLQRMIAFGDAPRDLTARRDSLMAEMSVKNEARTARNTELIAERDALLAA